MQRKDAVQLITMITDAFLSRDEQREALLHLDDIYEQLKAGATAEIDCSTDRVRDMVKIAYHIVRIANASSSPAGSETDAEPTRH